MIGSTFGGGALGVVGGLAAWFLNATFDPASSVRTIVVVVAAMTALGFEATNRERLLPSRTRQVNENWIQTYRGWIYGGGFGAELGFGLSTIITTSLIHLLVVSMIFVGSFAAAFSLGLTFGVVRGATVLFARGVDSPEALRSFHHRLDTFRTRSHSGAVASLALVSVIGLTAMVI